MREAKAFVPRLSEFILATTGGRDVRIQTLANKITECHLRQGLFSVHVWSWHDISDEIANHPHVLATHYFDLVRVLFAAVIRSESQGMLTNSIGGEIKVVGERHQEVVRYATDLLLGSAGSRTFVSKPETTNGQHAPSEITATSVSRNSSMKPPLPHKRDRRNKSVQVVPPSHLQTLGILAVAGIPQALPDLKRLFPDEAWDKHLQYLYKRGLVKSRGTAGGIEVPTDIKRALLADRQDEMAFRQLWIDALEPLKSHVDTALLLSIQYLRVRRFVPAITTLTDLAPGLEPGTWNRFYCSSLLALAKPRLLRLLTPQQKVEFYNSVGLCLSQNGDYRKAVEWFVRLRRYARRVGHRWGLGQSFINCGVTFARLNDAENAERCYRNAVTHARRTRDRHLLGRSLHNLAMTIYLHDVVQARKLLADSARIKRNVGDRQGVVGTYLANGILEAHAKNPSGAVRWFTKAEQLAQRLDHRDSQTIASYNLGLAWSELERSRESLACYRRARTIAEEEGFADSIVSILKGEARALEAMKDYEEAESTFRRILTLVKGDTEDAVFALHATAVMILRQNRFAEARRLLTQASVKARKAHLDDWAYKCLSDIAVSYVEVEKDYSKAIRSLRRAAGNEEKRKSYGVAGRLWERVYDLLVQRHGKKEDIMEGFDKCLSCLDRSRDRSAMIFRVLGNYHSWKWEGGDFDGALATLRVLEAKARHDGDTEWACRALDQTGLCLQELGRFDEAERYHRQALTIARRKGYERWTEHSLNNLGEVLRKQDRPKEAIKAFVEAESCARKRGNIEDAISTSHNRALALEAQGKTDQSARLLRDCRAVAKKNGWWREYVRALHGLANIAWIQKKPRVAEQEYAKALTEAQRLKIADQVCGISLNYSNALKWNGRAKRGLRVLQAVEDRFTRLPEAHEYFIQLAILSQTTGNPSQEKQYWQLARQHAQQRGNRDKIALCSGALAELYQAEHAVGQAERELRVALEYETEPEPRAALLMQWLGLLFNRKAGKEASRVLTELQALATQHDLTDDCIDAYMMAGDYNWDEGGGRWAGANLYVAAMIRSITGQDGQRIWELGTHLVKQLCLVKGQVRDNLERRARDWLVKTVRIGPEEKDLVLVLWPFRVAKRIATEIGDWGNVSEKQYVTIVKREIKAISPRG